MTPQFIHHINFWLSEHPSVVQFRWSPTESWAATWWFLITSITAYIGVSGTTYLLLRLLRREKAVPLGPIPALHSLAMSCVSATIFSGMLAASASEIRDTRWFWQRSRTPAEWLLCFPLGTRPSGRVFFWSYAFYLSRFLHASRTFLFLLRHPGKFSCFHVICHSFLVCMAFLWLEFSQSSQVLAILAMTMIFAVVYAYRFCVENELVVDSERYLSFVMLCRIVLVVTNSAIHVGVLVLHFSKGGCNGMGAWLFNATLNSLMLFLVLEFKSH